MAKLNILTLGSSKNYTDLAALGLTNVVVNDQDKTISFTLVADGSTRTLHFDQPSDGKDGVSITNISVDANNNLVCTMSDGTEQKAKIDLLDDVYTKAETDTLLLDKAEKNHNHDSAYASKDTEHEHSNKETLDKFDVNENGKLTFNGDVVTPEASDLSDYLKKTDAQNTYVAKETGKGLSTNDYTTEEKEKLAGIENYDDTALSNRVKTIEDDYAKSSDIPSLSGYATETWVNEQGFLTQHQDLSNYATKDELPSLDGYAKTSEIPSKVSELENDSNYLSSIPEEYVTDTELSAKGYLTEHQDISGKVDKVDGKSLIADTEIERLASVDNYDDTDIRTELAKKADATTIPSKVSELTNDSNYQTAEQVSSTVTTEIAKVVADAPESLNTLKEMSDWIAGHEDDASAMNSAISDNKTAITALQTGKADKSEIPTTIAELTDSADYAKTTDIPTTLPANGGNSDTVNGHTVNSDVPENAKFTDTTYSDATQIEHGLMSADDKKKLDGLTKYTPDGTTITADEDGTLHGVAKVTVDDAMSSTSTNPVQNKVVKAYVDKKASENVDFSTSTSKLLNGSIEAQLVLSNATRNLLNPTLATTTKDGVTCTNNGDGTYTLNGTASGNVFFVISGVIYDKNIINKYEGSKLVGAPSGSSYESFFLFAQFNGGQSTQKVYNDYGNGIKLNNIKGYETLEIIICVISGKTVSNLTFKPMLTTDLSATYDDFVPYGGYEIKTCGKNLLNLTKITTNNTGVTASVSNGIITLNGTVDTSGGWQDLYFNTDEQYISLKRGVKYTISTKDKVQKVFLMLRRHNGLEIVYSHDCSTNGTTFVASQDMVCQITITFKESSTFNNKQIAPQIEVGEKATEYEQYQDGGTVNVDHTTEFPLLGLKSFDGITNIISPGNVKCVYPTNESGKGVLDSLYNKDKMLTEQKKSLEVIGKCKNLLNPTLQTTTQNGVTCTNNGDGTYTLNGTATDGFSFCLCNVNLNKFIHKTCLLIDCGKAANSSGNSSGKPLGLIAKETTSWNWVTANDSNDYKVILDEYYYTKNVSVRIEGVKGDSYNNAIVKPMITTNLNATYDDFVPYTGDGDTLASDVAEIKKDLGGLTFSASGTTLTITDGTNTWTLGANS